MPSFTVAAARLAGVGLLVAAPLAPAATLYDPARDSLPSAQDWTASSNGGFVESVSAGRYRLDTTAAPAGARGFGRIAPTALDTAAGFALGFDLRVEDENHATPNRAGFSFIVTGQDPRRAIEIGFWRDRVWAYAYDAADPDRFVHGAEALFDTASVRSYVLTLQDQQYSLSVGGRTLLSGALVDYGAQGQPYATPNFVFFGDDSSRAGARIDLGAVTLAPVPEPASATLLAAGLLAGLFAARRRDACGLTSRTA